MDPHSPTRPPRPFGLILDRARDSYIGGGRAEWNIQTTMNALRRKSHCLVHAGYTAEIRGARVQAPVQAPNLGVTGESTENSEVMIRHYEANPGARKELQRQDSNLTKPRRCPKLSIRLRRRLKQRTPLL